MSIISDSCALLKTMKRRLSPQTILRKPPKKVQEFLATKTDLPNYAGSVVTCGSGPTAGAMKTGAHPGRETGAQHIARKCKCRFNNVDAVSAFAVRGLLRDS